MEVEKRSNYEDAPLCYDTSTEYRDETDVGNGAWVLITRTIPIATYAQPHVYGIYWGIPHTDSYDRLCCKIFTTETVVLLNHEYVVISEQKLSEYKSEGWELRENTRATVPLNIEVIENGRNLCDEERDVIYALMLDGLTEEQACEEYFLCHHTEADNYSICYIPNEKIFEQIIDMFGVI